MRFRRSIAVLRIADLFHPIDGLAIQGFLNGDMRHRRRRRRSMPVFLTRRKPDHVAWIDFLDEATFALRPSAAGRNDNGLTEWMRMPRSAGSRSNVTLALLTRAGSGVWNRESTRTAPVK
jgi:hypothetical protein